VISTVDGHVQTLDVMLMTSYGTSATSVRQLLLALLCLSNEFVAPQCRSKYSIYVNSVQMHGLA